MFFGVVLHREDTATAVQYRAWRHIAALQETGWVGEIESRPFSSGLLFFDASSPHALLTEDPHSAAFAIVGGYIDGPDSWNSGKHWSEGSEAAGEFGAARIDSSGQRATGYADPAGSWPIYFGGHFGISVISNDPLFAAVALGEMHLSRQGAFELLRYGHALGRQTTVKGVQRIFPGESVEISTSTGPVVQRLPRRYEYSAGASVNQQHARGRDNLAGALASVGPLKDRSTSVTIQISGGLDSRLTAAAFAETYEARPEMVTLDLSDDDEIAIARQVAERLGFPHRVESLGQTTLDDARAGWLLTGGQVSVHAAAGNVTSYQTARPGPDGERIIVGGWPGDCLIGSYVPDHASMLKRSAVRSSVKRWARGRASDWESSGIRLSGRSAGNVSRRAKRTLERRILSSSGKTAAQRISYWAMFTRQPTFSYLSPAVLTSRVLAVTPLLARGYIDVLMTLSGDQIINKNFYRQFIRGSFPILDDIAYAATGKPIDSDVRLPGVRWRTRHERFHDLPQWLKRVVRLAVRVRDGRPVAAAVDLSKSSSSEIRFWDAFLHNEGASPIVRIGGIEVDASRTNDLHVRSMSLALEWTLNHLKAMATPDRGCRDDLA